MAKPTIPLLANPSHTLIDGVKSETQSDSGEESCLNLKQIVSTAFSLIEKFKVSVGTGQKTTVYTSVDTMYGEDDLSSCPLFKGGYINFGWWEGVDLSLPISDVERIQSQRNLYHHVLQTAQFNPEDITLEAGSGLGFGCILSSTDYKAKSITGLDFSDAQLSRAKRIHEGYLSQHSEVQFVQGAAESLPFRSDTFTKVISVEAAQHFRSLNSFLGESFRTLKTNGKLVIATFFATSENSIARLKGLIPTIQDGIDKAIPIESVEIELKRLGFKDVKILSIGDKVWVGFDKWIYRCGMGDTWNKNWLTSYQEKLVDYYLIEATK